MIETADPSVKIQYELLSIIDSKATALLSFNALLIAAISIWLGYVPLNVLHLLLDIAFLTLLASCMVLLWIIWLQWSQPTEGPALEILREKRTACFRAAWRISMAAVIVVSTVSVVHTVGTGLSVFGLCQSGTCKHFFSDEIFGNLDRIAKP